MKAIDELIAKFCPDGVEYKPLGEIATSFTRGSGIKRDEVTVDGVPCVRYGEIYTTYNIGFNTCISHTTSKAANRAKCFEHGDILFAITGEKIEDIAKCIAYVGHEQCYAGGDVVIMKHNQDPKYLAYALSTVEVQKQKSKGKVKSKVVHSSVPALKAIVIPLPALTVQREIVRILDSFTGLIAELEAELAARRKQYEQYRDRVLDSGVSDIYCCLSEVILSLNTGLNPRQFFKLNTKDAANYYVTIREIHDGKIVFSDKTDRINDTALWLCDNRSNLEVGDVLFSGTGTIGETAVIEAPPTNWNIKEGVYAVKPDPSKVLPRYLHYAFMCSSVRKAYGARIFGGTVKSISMKDLRKIKIPVPSIPEQRRVVEILDRFDALCNDETAGLTAEIAARKKQYEYYRDRLLTFKRKEEGGSVESAQRGKRNSPRKGGRYYTEDGMERLKRSGMKGHEAAERLIAEQIGERHRLLRPLTREAASILKSVKGMIPRALFLSNAIVREAERRAKEEKT